MAWALPLTEEPSSLLGEASVKRRLLPQPRLFRVSTPVTLFFPEAYLHRACARPACQCQLAAERLRQLRAGCAGGPQTAEGAHNLLGLVEQGVGEVCTVDLGVGQVAPAPQTLSVCPTPWLMAAGTQPARAHLVSTTRSKLAFLRAACKG